MSNTVRENFVEIFSAGELHFAETMSDDDEEKKEKEDMKQLLKENRLMSRLKGKILCIEGNIATGKTTLVNRIKEKMPNILPLLQVEIVAESIDESILSEFNAEPKTFAYKIQDYMLQRRVEAIARAKFLAKQGKCVIMDTGGLREYVFSNANKNMGNLTEEQRLFLWNKFTKLHDETNNAVPNIIVLLVCTSLVCMDNIKHRNRTNETALSIDYIEEIRRLYEFAVTIPEESLNSKGQACRIVSVDVTNDYADADSVIDIMCSFKE